MPYELFDYVGANGRNEIRVWTEGLQKPLRAKLNQRLDMLAKLGDKMLPQMLSATGTPGILKIKLKGRVMARPLLCRGPIDDSGEYTLLLGAFERDWKLVPKDAEHRAAMRKGEVAADPKNRRKKHERVT